MSIEMLLAEVRALSSEQRRMLMAYLISLEDGSRADYAAELAKRIDDQSSDRWLTPEQCERKLRLS